MKKNRRLSGCLTGVAWVGVISSFFLIGAAVWFHHNLDPIIRIPFVLFCGGGGVMIGLGSLGYIVTARFQ